MVLCCWADSDAVRGGIAVQLTYEARTDDDSHETQIDLRNDTGQLLQQRAKDGCRRGMCCNFLQQLEACYLVCCNFPTLRDLIDTTDQEI